MSLWVEKYRPRDFHHVQGQTFAIDVLSNSLKDMPNFLFYGPPGTGKTSTALIITKKRFKKRSKDFTLFLNASVDRSIHVIRSKVKLFCDQALSKEFGCRIIIMDEADALTRDSQKALLRIVERFSTSTRFIFMCNYESKIIDALQSRCVRLHFNKLSPNFIFQRLSFIVLTEKITVDEKILHQITEFSNGDIRCAIQTLQDFSMSNLPIEHFCGFFGSPLIDKFLDRKTDVISVCRSLSSCGYSFNEIITYLTRSITSSSTFSTWTKSKIGLLCSDLEYRSMKGCDSFLLFIELFLTLHSEQPSSQCRKRIPFALPWGDQDKANSLSVGE